MIFYVFKLSSFIIKVQSSVKQLLKYKHSCISQRLKINASLYSPCWTDASNINREAQTNSTAEKGNKKIKMK